MKAVFGTIHVLGCYLVLFLGAATGQTHPDSAEVLQQAHARIAHLCSDEMAGRGYQRQGHLKAATFIAEQFRTLGLVPIGSQFALGHNPTATQAYFQPFSFEVNLHESASLQLGNRRHVVGPNFVPAGYSGAGMASGRLVSVGSASPEEITQNVNGEIAVMTAALPASYRLDAARYPAWLGKIQAETFRVQQLVAAGARAVIVLKPKLTTIVSNEALPIPVVELVDSVWDNHNKPHGRPRRGASMLRGRVSVAGGVQTVQTQNVVAMLQGTDPTAPAIILCGHYDHLGQVGEAVFRGANDNASGVAFLLCLAQFFATEKANGRGLANPLIFIAFSGEEAGLHGSMHYANTQPLFPLERTQLVLNFDLLGYGEAGAMCLACQTYPALSDSLHGLCARLANPLSLSTRPNRPNSDHWPFTQKGVQALFFYLQGGKTHYHDVHDRPEELSLAGFWALRKLVTAFVAEQAALSVK